MIDIYIGVGHGGSDSGAIGCGRLEKTLTLETATEITRLLRNVGYIVKQSRTTDCNFNSTLKIQEATKENAPILLDIHYNAYNKVATGCEVFYPVKNKRIELAKKISDSICSNISSTINIKNRGSKNKLNGANDYYIINRYNGIGLLIEPLFIDNIMDIKKYNAEKIAKAICQALVSEYPKNITQGDKLFLNMCDIYGSAYAKTPLKTYTGIYYIYDTKIVNNMVRITNSSSRVGKLPECENVSAWLKLSC